VLPKPATRRFRERYAAKLVSRHEERALVPSGDAIWVSGLGPVPGTRAGEERR
jgi:hypothetical protein